MQKNKVLIIAVIIIVILIIAGYAYYKWAPELSEEKESSEEITPPEPTGEISDLIEALEKEIQDELNVVYEGDEDGDLITSDSEEVNDFGRSADDTGL